MKFGSLFSGIGGFDLGFERSGMECTWQCEIDMKCQDVLRNKFGVKIYDDVKTITAENTERVNLICGGFPCQDVSIAGKRAGLAGERSGLWFEFHRVLSELLPQWVVIENVPGLLSSNRGRDFAVILSGLAEIGYLSSWRVLDAQYFGVPQRRRRVFIVASLGCGCSAEVLFESESVCGDIAEGRKEGKEVTSAITTKPYADNESNESRLIGVFGGNNTAGEISVATACNAHGGTGRIDFESETFVAFTPRRTNYVGVRRLMPIECERLQGFPDNWTNKQSDSVRYKQLGNAVCVPVAEWIGRRIIEANS